MKVDAELVSELESEAWVRLTGIMTAQPMILMQINMFRHIFVKRRKSAASRPTVSMSWGSRVRITGVIHEKIPLPTGGGACFESACLTFGA